MPQTEGSTEEEKWQELVEEMEKRGAKERKQQVLLFRANFITSVMLYI